MSGRETSIEFQLTAETQRTRRLRREKKRRLFFYSLPLIPSAKPPRSLRLCGITLATGAAGLKGKIIPAGGARLPSRLRAHLVPAEISAKDDLLRFAETPVESDGSFRFANLAPGKYLITTRENPGSEAPDEPARQVAWDAAERAKLRKEAEAAKVEVELKAASARQISNKSS